MRIKSKKRFEPEKKRILSRKEKHQRKMQSPIGKVLVQWEEMRRKDCKPDRRTQLIDNIIETLKDRIIAAAFRPNFSRVFQSCVKHGTSTQHKVFLAAFRNKHSLLAKMSYSWPIEIAMLTYIKDPAAKQAITEELLTDAHILIHHKVGIRVLEHCYGASNALNKRKWLFAVFRMKEIETLSDNFKLDLDAVWQLAPHTKAPCLSKLQLLTDKMVSRGLVDPMIAHRLLDLQFSKGWYSYSVEMLTDLKKMVIHILHTAYGARVAVNCLRFANRETRRFIIESFQNSVMDMCKGKNSCYVVCVALDLVDNLKLVQGKILKEIKKDLFGMLTDPFAHLFLLHLLTPTLERKKKYLLPHQCSDVFSIGQSNTMDVPDEGPRHTEVTRTITLWKVHPLAKLGATWKYLSTSLKQILQENLPELASTHTSRRVLTELLFFAKNSPPPEMDLGEDVLLSDSSLLSLIETTLKSTKVTITPSNKESSELPDSKPKPIRPFPAKGFVSERDGGSGDTGKGESSGDDNDQDGVRKQRGKVKRRKL